MAPRDELDVLVHEATQTVEDELKLEDTGWINLSVGTADVIGSSERQTNLKLSRLYFAKDPLARQSIRLWTDYTFGAGMTWQTEDKEANEAMEAFWGAKVNQSLLSARGQRKSSDKLLVDGEIFFAIFLGETTTIRRIDPLEITEIISDEEDKDNVMFYRREWMDAQSAPHIDIYRDVANIKGKAALDSSGASIKHSQDALVYHLTYNTISQRGNPLLLPALDWIKQYRRFLASRVAIMLALARFAWRSKVKGGQTAVDAIKAKTHQLQVAAGSQLVENLGVDTMPIKTESGAASAYQDGRMIKLQIAAAVGIPEQYFGDISIGNLATAKTVELPMMKMFQSYQQVWNDTYQDIDEIVLEHTGIKPNKWYIDRDFPQIAPSDIEQAATAMVQILQVMPSLAASDDVKQIALMTLGVNDPKEVIELLKKEEEEKPEEPPETENTEAALLRVFKGIKESLRKKE